MQISIKDLKPMPCIGFRGYDDEWYPDSRYRKYLKLDNHHYTVYISKERANKWSLRIYLCLTAVNSEDVLVLKKVAKTMKELKKTAVDEINEYHNSYRCNYDIAQWKETHGKEVFDQDFNYLGISYTSPEREKNNSGYDYYNNQKPKIGYGTYYMLLEESVMVCKIGCGFSVTKWDKSEELRSKLLAASAARKEELLHAGD